MNLSFEASNDSFPEMSYEVYWIKTYAILFYYDSIIPALWEIKVAHLFKLDHFICNWNKQGVNSYMDESNKDRSINKY